MQRIFVVSAIVMASLAGTTPADADDPADTPGTAPLARASILAAVPASPVAPVFVDSGLISLSVDAVGTNVSSGAAVDVDKPVGGTVRSAFLVASSTGFSGYEPVDGDITIEGQPIAWDAQRTMTNGIGSVNVFAEVTSVVKPILDAAPSGLVSLTVAEGARTTSIDGSILAVVFDDPTATINRGVVLAYGAQQVTGDRIRLVRLPDGPLTDVEVNLGVGISYGFQPSSQDSTINVNGTRLSTSAGGQDDGEARNGALITVGGIGDDPANPTDPFARGNQGTCPRCDDELYDLTSFVTADAVTELELTTTNPSADDNFMFAALDVRGATVTWTSSADPCAGIDIAVCYAPELRFHPDENFYPMNASSWILGTELRWAADKACRDSSLGTAITAERLTNDTYRHYEISDGLCNERTDDTWYRTTQWTRPFGEDTAPNGEPRAQQKDGDTLANNEGFFLKWVDGDKPRGAKPNDNNEINAPLYVEQTADKITYWFFYGYDPKSNLPGDGILAHDGDWERIEVNLANGVATNVEYFGHGCSTGLLNWPPDDTTDTTHPRVYVAQGTHASYSFSGRLPGASLCAVGKGITDQTSFTDDSVIWQTWTGIGIVPVQSQCWYGFGGAWGDTGGTVGIRGDQTGPAGPPFNGSTRPRLPATTDCNNAFGQLSFDPLAAYEWLEEIVLEFTGGTAGLDFTAAFESVPIKVAEGTVGPDGSTTVRFIVPPGTSQGLHDIVIRATDTGEDLFVIPVQIDIPPECATPPGVDDVDGDGVRDICDPNPIDGPLGDADGDGVLNGTDNCDTVGNPGQESFGERSEGSACDRREGFNPIPSYLVVDYLDGPFCSFYVPTIWGTDGDDQINGTSGADVIYAGAGDDDINGKDGDDIICGGDGNDSVNAQNGNDTVFGGDGDDDIRGQNGDDRLFGEAGDDDLKGQAGDDLLVGGDGDDSLKGGSGINDLQE